MIKLKMYNDNYWSLCRIPDKVCYVDEYKHKRHKRFDNDKFSSPEEIERISLSRTKNNIKNICLSNNFEYFCTFTINSQYADRYCLQEVQDKMKKICKKIQRNNKDFKYIYITEKHKDGAFHFHGMVKNIELYQNEFGYLSSKDFDVLGYNSFSKIENYNACCHYITKYITKDCIKNENNQIYFCSRGLSKGFDEYMIDYNLKDIFTNCSKVYENEYCQKIDFEIDKISIEHQKKLFAYFNYNDNVFQNYNNNITNILHLLTKTKIKFI